MARCSPLLLFNSFCCEYALKFFEAAAPWSWENHHRPQKLLIITYFYIMCFVEPQKGVHLGRGTKRSFKGTISTGIQPVLSWADQKGKAKMCLYLYLSKNEKSLWLINYAFINTCTYMINLCSRCYIDFSCGKYLAKLVCVGLHRNRWSTVLAWSHTINVFVTINSQSSLINNTLVSVHLYFPLHWRRIPHKF